MRIFRVILLALFMIIIPFNFGGSDNAMASALQTISGEMLAQPLNDNFSYLASTISAIATSTATSTVGYGYYNVKDYGAVGDNATDDTTAIRSAISAAETLATANYHPILYFPACVGYYTSDTITIPKWIDVDMDAPIIYHGTTNEAALVVGSDAIASLGSKLKLNVIRNTVSDWSSEDCIGIQLLNQSTSFIQVIQSNGFTIGVQCMGSGALWGYNEVRLGNIINNKYALDLTNQTSGISGACNENIFIGGRYTYTTGTNTGVSRYGVRITSKDATYLANNNNVFLKPCFELGKTQATPGEALPILVVYGQENAFHDIRDEGNGDYCIKTQNGSMHNTVTIGYLGGSSLGYMLDSGTYPTTIVTDRRLFYRDLTFKPIFNSGAMHKTACYYDGATQVNVPRLHIAASGTSAVYKAESGITIAGTYLEVPGARGVGIFLNTVNQKRFAVRKDVDTGYGGRIYIRCYDSADTILDSAGAGHPYVKGTSGAGFNYTADYGKTYASTSDSVEDAYFEVGSGVAYVAVMLTGGSAVMRIRSFSIESMEGHTETWTGYEEMIPGANLGTTYPTTGTWAKGRIVLNDAASAGETVGWICTTGSTAGGTWNGFGAIN